MKRKEVTSVVVKDLPILEAILFPFAMLVLWPFILWSTVTGKEINWRWKK